jgi:general nucleoside transport system permease protein
MNTSSQARPNIPLAIFAAVAALLSFALPFATIARSFGGQAAIFVHPSTIMDFTGFLPKTMPDLSNTTLFIWLTLVALLLTSGLAWFQPKLVWIGGALTVTMVVISFVVYAMTLDAVHAPLLANGTAYRRLPFVNFGPSLWAFVAFFTGVGAIVSSLRSAGRFSSFFQGVTGAIVPAISIVLALVVCGVLILLLQVPPGLDKAPAGLMRDWLARADLLWFSYSMLFGSILPKFRPTLDFAPVWQSLSLATPLIFTGLGLAFGFRTGLFNIGAPGQIMMGGIFCAAIGIYVSGPWFIIAPLCVIAAAVGGGLWGALPGWLKGRFGASEVINTIMLNNIASGVLIFLIGSNEYKFFGNTVTLPFKAEGGEARSLEFGAGAHLANITDPFSVTRDGSNFMALPIPFLLLGLILGFAFSRGNFQARGISAGVGAVMGLVFGFVLREIPITGAMQTAALNLSFVIAILAAGFVGVFLWRTKWGFELRAVGLSPKAAEYGGVNIAKNTVLAMAISGALCGLAATHFTMGGALAEYRLKQAIPADSVGFGGITVALLGQNTPAGVVASSILFGVLGTGGLRLDQALDDISREIVTVLQALIVLFIATQGFLSGDFLRSINGIKKSASPKKDSSHAALDSSSANKPDSSSKKEGGEA